MVQKKQKSAQEGLTITLRLPKAPGDAIREYSDTVGISINAAITVLLADQLSLRGSKVQPYVATAG